jgi:hypothetical protein
MSIFLFAKLFLQVFSRITTQTVKL